MLLNFNFILIIFYGTFFNFLKIYGAIPLLLIAFFSGISLLFNEREIYFYSFLKKYQIYFFYSFIILIISLFNFMPKSWTVYFDRMIALRQFFYILSLPLFLFISYKFFKRYFFFIQKNINFFLIFYLVIIGVQDFILFGNVKFFSTLTNETLIWLLLLFIFLEKNSNKLFNLITLLSIFILSFYLEQYSSLQFKLYIFILIIIYLTKLRYFISISVLSFSVLITFIPDIFLNYFQNYLDENTKVRLVMWIDSLQALFQTYGFGVGFGTEWIKNEFYLIKDADWILFEFDNFNRIMNTTSHSSFSDIYFRLGILGLLLFSIWFKNFLNQKLFINNLYTNSFLLMIFSISTNPGLFSINFFMGLSITMGMIVYISEVIIINQEN